tara:strand:+ start:404 stop:748 length:345 start_codon:yes stop_codon:yes gene_type:complete
MPRISKYELDGSLSNNDKLLGSDEAGNTKNFKLKDVADFCAANGGVFKFTQNSLSDTWTITHNLDIEDHLPHVTIKSDSGTYNNYEILGDIRYVNKNQLIIHFHTAQRGFAFIG